MRTARDVPTPLLCRNSMISRMTLCSAQPAMIRSGRFGHQGMMGIRALGRHRDEAGDDRWRDQPHRLAVGSKRRGPFRVELTLPSSWMKTKLAESLRREDLTKPLDRAQHPLLWQPRP